SSSRRGRRVFLSGLTDFGMYDSGFPWISRYAVRTSPKLVYCHSSSAIESIMNSSDTPLTAGARLRVAITEHPPLQIVGTIHSYAAMMAERVGFRAIYLSGAGVANASLGLPDLGISTLHDVLEDARRITAASSLPLLVDADTGWGGAFSIARAVRELIRAGAAGMHIEDQQQANRCGHRPNKATV